MLLEEKDALTKFCSQICTNCKGSGCMQWRWAFDRCTVNEFDRKAREAEGYRAIEVRAGNIPMFTMVKPNGLGYCGLGDKPVAEIAAQGGDQ